MLRYWPGEPPSTLLIIVTWLTRFLPSFNSSHLTYPDDKVIADSGTIECVDGDDFSPTWYVGELELLGDEFVVKKVFIRISRPDTEGRQHTHKVEHNGTLTTRGRKPEPPGEFFILKSPIWIQYLSVQGGYNQFGCLTSMRSNSCFAVHIALQNNFSRKVLFSRYLNLKMWISDLEKTQDIWSWEDVDISPANQG